MILGQPHSTPTALVELLEKDLHDATQEGLHFGACDFRTGPCRFDRFKLEICAAKLIVSAKISAQGDFDPESTLNAT